MRGPGRPATSNKNIFTNPKNTPKKKRKNRTEDALEVKYYSKKKLK